MPAAARNIQPHPGLFASTVYADPDAVLFALSHASRRRTPQSPFFAQSSVTDAYLAAQPKMDLNNSSSVRLALSFVVRLGSGVA